jgi:hypothetical protein
MLKYEVIASFKNAKEEKYQEIIDLLKQSGYHRKIGELSGVKLRRFKFDYQTSTEKTEVQMAVKKILRKLDPYSI